MTADGLNNQAISLLDLNKKREAEGLWKRALEIEPEHAESTYNRHLHLWRTGRITDSVMFQSVQAVANPQAEEWMPRYMYARLLLERGDYVLADRVLSGLDAVASEDHGVRLAKNVAATRVRITRRTLGKFPAHDDPVTAVFLSLNGWRALTGSKNGVIKLWGMLKVTCERELHGHSGAILSACLSNDEKLALSGSADNTLKLWQTNTGRCLRTFRGPRGHDAAVSSVLFNPDKTGAVSASLDGTIKMWDISTGECTDTLRGHRDGVTGLDLFAKRGRILSSSMDGTLKVWDMETGKCVKTLEGHEDSVSSGRFSPNRRLVVSASLDRTGKVWLLTFRQVPSHVRGPQQPIVRCGRQS